MKIHDSYYFTDIALLLILPALYTISNAFPMLYVCNLGNYANMQITKIAQGGQGGKQAEFALISI